MAVKSFFNEYEKKTFSQNKITELRRVSINQNHNHVTFGFMPIEMIQMKFHARLQSL